MGRRLRPEIGLVLRIGHLPHDSYVKLLEYCNSPVCACWGDDPSSIFDIEVDSVEKMGSKPNYMDVSIGFSSDHTGMEDPEFRDRIEKAYEGLIKVAFSETRSLYEED